MNNSCVCTTVHLYYEQWKAAWRLGNEANNDLHNCITKLNLGLSIHMYTSAGGSLTHVYPARVKDPFGCDAVSLVK